MNYDVLIDGLKSRGFSYTEDICNMGGCHKDEMHFILLTDGLVIYSNFWDWKAADKNLHGLENGVCEVWCLEPSDWDTKTKEFSFKELDFIMTDLYGKTASKK
jgi:hypothetical protein